MNRTALERELSDLRFGQWILRLLDAGPVGVKTRNQLLYLEGSVAYLGAKILLMQ